MASSQNDEIQPANQEVSSPIESSSSQTSPQEYPELHSLIVSSHSDTKSLPIPNSNSIKLGTRVSVNYAGYHLHPWEYFKDKISDLEGDEPVDSPTQGQIETWRRFVLDDNEELKPPSLDEKELIDLMHEKILKIFEKESEFKSVQERRVVHKDLDRVVYHLFVQKMRIEVRMLEIEEMKTKLGLNGNEGNTIEKDISEIKSDLKILIEFLEKIDGTKFDVKYFKTEKEELDVRLDKMMLDLKNKDSRENDEEELSDLLAGANDIYKRLEYLSEDKSDWKIFKRVVLERRNLEEEVPSLLNNLRQIPIREVQDLESRINLVKAKIVTIEREVKTLQQRMKYMCHALEEIQKAQDASQKQQGMEDTQKQQGKEDTQKQQGKEDTQKQQGKEDTQKQQGKKDTQKQQDSILPKKKDQCATQTTPNNNPKTTLTIDQLNSYLRYPPIENDLILHEGFWPPLRAVKSEGTTSIEYKGGKDEFKASSFEEIKLSNVIGRFDEAFTEFSSTLADHGMPRPTPQPRPITFRYGLGEVIPAWDHPTKGISDMKLGEIRIMVCPSSTAYGEKGVPSKVPPFMPLLYIIRMDAIYNSEDISDESDYEDEINDHN